MSIDIATESLERNQVWPVRVETRTPLLCSETLNSVPKQMRQDWVLAPVFLFYSVIGSVSHLCLNGNILSNQKHLLRQNKEPNNCPLKYQMALFYRKGNKCLVRQSSWARMSGIMLSSLCIRTLICRRYINIIPSLEVFS